jgi:hypothetical protein
MQWMFADRTLVFRRLGRPQAAIAVFVAFLILIVAPLQRAYAIQLPSEDEQDVLVRSALMTFNDANMSGDYAVLWSKVSRQFQTQVPVEKFAPAFEKFRTNALFFESIINKKYESREKPVIDANGVLTLAGAIKSDEMRVKYQLRLVQNEKAWKLIGINVDVTRI